MYRAKPIKITIQIPISTSRFKNPQCATRSALDKNLNAKANSKKPRIILIVCSHPPDLGIECIQLGNDANKAKGRAKANPKPDIPTLNCIAPPSDVKEPANKDPKIGPVHENETMARVNAIKKIPINPPILEAESILSPQELGNVIS
ncbi:MAG: Uncharacterised protein [Flavobacterium sp. SCGC AAA160-P02]|nr:MAG: Uncharacterised protein [Flavobacterium sp. SCGC AAA160-P02]